MRRSINCHIKGFPADRLADGRSDHPIVVSTSTNVKAIFGGHWGQPICGRPPLSSLADLPFRRRCHEAWTPSQGPSERKEYIPMRTLYIRWILPVVALLVIATAFVLGAFSPTVGAHAASHHAKTTTTTSTSTKPTSPTSIFDSYWGH